MIVFNLRCGADHVFEAWFRDGAGFETQAAAGKVACPICGDTKVGKAPMAPHVASARNDETAKKSAETWKKLHELRRHVEDNCEHVGERFAEEARKIHHGEAEKRDIYGGATDDEARDLKDEGVPFSRIPWVPRHDS